MVRIGTTNAQNVNRTVDNITFRDIRKDKTVTPSWDLWSNVVIQDKNGNNMGQLSQISFTDGAQRTAIGVNNGSNNAFLCMQVNSDGNTYLFQEQTISGVYSSKQIPRMEVVDIANYPATLEITGIGTKLANCKYCQLYWHDTRIPSYHAITTLPGQSGGYSTGISPATYELTQGGGVFFIGVYVQNVSANKIAVSAKWARISDNVWGDYLQYMVFEKIVFYY